METTTRRRSRKGAPGIVEVAARAGVSPATVSRFYNTPDLVKAPTRERIEQAAADLGYIRDRMAGTLHNRFSGTIGLVVPTMNNAIFSELIEAFSGELLKHDRTMLIASHNYDLDLEVSIIRSLLERRIDGVAIVGHDHSEVALAMLKVRGVPVVTLWNHNPEQANAKQQDSGDTLPCIGVDNRAAASLVTRHVLELGHEDIALVFPDTDHNDRARDRRDAAMETMRSHGVVVPMHRVYSCPYNISRAKALATEVLQNDPPTAFVCGNDVIAHGVMYAAMKLGLRIPDDLSVVGIGDFAGSADMEPGLTTVRLPARRIGSIAAETLIAMSEDGRSSARSVALDCHLQLRGSTRQLTVADIAD